MVFSNLDKVVAYLEYKEGTNLSILYFKYIVTFPEKEITKLKLDKCIDDYMYAVLPTNAKGYKVLAKKIKMRIV